MRYGIQPPEFRLPPEAHIGGVCLQVTDLERSSDFYQQLGFSVLEGGADGIRLGVSDTVLIDLRAGARAPQTQRRLGLYHFAILLPDRVALGAMLRRLLEAGVRPGAADHLVSEALYIQDPDGLGIEIYRDRPQSDWKVRGDELAMASDPLDFEGVLQAGAGVEWHGMPVATRLGHVHLYVGDIDKAKAFYHAALGLDVMVSSYPGALFMSAGGYHHHLGVNTWAGPNTVPSRPDEARLLWWDLALPSDGAVEGAAKSLADNGYSVTAKAVGVRDTQDPWGTVLRLRVLV